MLTPYQIEKTEKFDFDECYSQLRFRSKRTEEGRQKYFKTNALVPKKAVLRKEEGATVDLSAIFYPTFSQRAVRLSFVGSKAVQRKSKPSGNTHKIPFISDYRVVASAKFSDI